MIAVARRRAIKGTGGGSPIVPGTIFVDYDFTKGTATNDLTTFVPDVGGTMSRDSAYSTITAVIANTTPKRARGGTTTSGAYADSTTAPNLTHMVYGKVVPADISIVALGGIFGNSSGNAHFIALDYRSDNQTVRFYQQIGSGTQVGLTTASVSVSIGTPIYLRLKFYNTGVDADYSLTGFSGPWTNLVTNIARATGSNTGNVGYVFYDATVGDAFGDHMERLIAAA